MKIVNIDLDKVIPAMIDLCVDICGHGISQVDAVRVAELLEDSAVQGEWITGKYSFDRSVCSVCGATFDGDGGNYCSKCGARMTED